MKNKESYYKRTKSFLYVFYLILWGINWENRQRKFRDIKQHVFRTKAWMYRYIYWYYRGVPGHSAPVFDGKVSDLWITDIKVRVRWRYIYVDIYSYRPGMVIGRQGKDFYTLQNYLNERSSKEVKVSVIDFNPFEF